MRRKACALVLTAALGGCVSTDPNCGPVCTGSWGHHNGPPTVPGTMGPGGQPLAMAAPYNVAPPGSPWAAQQMMANSVPLDMVQMNRGGNVPGMGGAPGGMMPPTQMPQGGVLTPPGVPFAPGIPTGPNVTQSSFTPGNDSGVIHANVPPGASLGDGIMLAQLTGSPPPAAGPQIRFSAPRTQIRFTRPTGMKVAWFAQGPDGRPAFSNVPLEAPARYNFPQGAVYRLKLSNIEGRPGLEIYPTMEVVPCNAKTEAFLAHSAVPIEFTQDDFKQIAEGNFVTKVIYLPDPQNQDVTGTGTDEIVSTRLEPGANPINEALRRGSILVIIRMGNVDQEAPNTPPLNPAPLPGPVPPPNQHVPPGMMVPYPGYLPQHGQLPPGALPPGAMPQGAMPQGPWQQGALPPGAMPQGGPMIAAPANPFGAPPGFSSAQSPSAFPPLVPPPGSFVPPVTPPPAATDSGAGVLFPPPGGAEKNSAGAPLAPVPPPLIPAPIIAPATTTPVFEGAKAKAAPPIAATAPATGAAKSAPAITPPPLPTAPPALPDVGATKIEAGVPPAPPPLPALPTFPGADDSKKLDLKDSSPMPPVPSAPPVPITPSSKMTGSPVVMPTAGTVPMLPQVDEASGGPAFPAAPGTLRTAAPLPGAPNNGSLMPIPTNPAANR